ncbi:MAG: hypothetical protein GX922_01305 [Firmicutes bacterium]|nr:hypothetical protein [Bacillota bacterium]
MNRQLQDVLALFHQHKINYWLDSGTLLGLMREGELLESDKDLDISVWDTELEKLQKILPCFHQAGYQVYAAYYQGQVFKYNLTPANLRKLRTVDINIYRKAVDYAWCPMNYFKFSASTKKKDTQSKRSFAKKVRALIRSAWKKLNTKIALNVHIDRLPWRPFLVLGTWWIPAEFYRQRQFDPDIQAWRPLRWEDYLAYRYGNWQQPQINWVFYRDDHGIKAKIPVDLIGLD